MMNEKEQGPASLTVKLSDDRGQIKGFVSTKYLWRFGVKLAGLDEADAISTSAHMELRCVLERYVANAHLCSNTFRLAVNHVIRGGMGWYTGTS